MGRPRRIVYADKYDQILAAFKQGHGIARVCKILECTRQRLGQLSKEDPNLFTILEQGKELAQEWWETKGLQNLKTRGFNTGLWTMFMKNRYGWHDKHKIEATTENTTHIKFDDAVVNSMVDKILETE